MVYVVCVSPETDLRDVNFKAVPLDAVNTRAELRQISYQTAINWRNWRQKKNEMNRALGHLCAHIG